MEDRKINDESKCADGYVLLESAFKWKQNFCAFCFGFSRRLCSACSHCVNKGIKEKGIIIRKLVNGSLQVFPVVVI